jgi:hypothetical protein
MEYLVFNKILLDSREVDEKGLIKIFGDKAYSIKGHLLNNTEYEDEYNIVRKLK